MMCGGGTSSNRDTSGTSSNRSFEFSSAPLSEGPEAWGSNKSWEQFPEGTESSVKSNFLSEFKLRSSSRLESPSESNQESEDGTNEGPDGVGSESFSEEIYQHESDTPLSHEDTSDLTGVGAVGEVVSGGDVRELTSKSSSKSSSA